MNGTVYIQNVSAYDDAVFAAVENIFAAAGLDGRIAAAQRIVVKPNLLMKCGPDAAVTTHPLVMQAVIRALQKRGAKDILIAESPGGLFTLSRLESIYGGCGMKQLAGEGVRLNTDLSAVTREALGRTFELLAPIAQSDLLISVGKLKTHAMTGMSGGVKNLFGAIPGLTKPQFHFLFPEKGDFCDMLCDLCALLDPALTVLDGVVGMEGDGPSAGVPRSFGLILGSRDPFALDRAAAHMLGLSLNEALTVKASVKKGLAPERAEDLTVAGDKERFDHPFTDVLRPQSSEADFSSKLPRPLRSAGSKLLRQLAPRPRVRTADCIGCGRCAESCPVHTIALVKGRAVIRKAPCIRCFCCHEMCPVHAIDISKNIVFKVLEHGRD